MHQRDRLIPLQGCPDSRDVGDVTFLKRSPFHCPWIATRKVVVCDRQISGMSKRLAGMAADVAGTAGHKDS